MQELHNKVGVITGGAGGIGHAMGRTFAAAGMRVVLADVDGEALDSAVAELKGEGATALGVVSDVRSVESMRGLRDQAIAAFGGVHVVCLNAGVAPTGPVLQMGLDTWRWLLDVNLMGVIHGVDAFAPLLVAAGEGHIVCTASAAGLVATPGLGAYCTTKHAVVGLAETLRIELAGTGVGVSVLCPSLVRTRIFESERVQPSEVTSPAHPDQDAVALFRGALDAMGTSPDDVAGAVMAAIRADRLYVLPHPEVADWVRSRAEAVAADATAGSPPRT
jgi:NAD(P)-dependent dehydrogenase (short-subunit alcohol dehydrogenase family)